MEINDIQKQNVQHRRYLILNCRIKIKAIFESDSLMRSVALSQNKFTGYAMIYRNQLK